ncbi:helix-turn-helix domain-containing protein [Dyella kyungheensis]|jgi:DNA-binding phage protein|uniref:Helix-turn-helix transcriptional regulator n=1 Tax=Dyella kyungheensis TaxID=1242174 RepID=A0ABS2JWY6_9GAMM|nr:helix-turn-helix transcriptional regulator [Dyella kyungheensis]MBM7123527.1 helix-turn-helix transcriptional regulator [Dyella kyungheensis]
MNMQKFSTNESSSTFADRIKVLIQRVGSVTEIARMCGFSEGVVRSWRDGNTDPSRARCVTLAKTMGISLVWLVAGEGTIQTTDAMSSGEDQTSAETLANRHRSKLRTAADTLHASGMAMDPNRLNTALRILQSELDLAESRLTLADNADMLADLYEILGPGGTDVDATAMVSFNQRLHERVKRGRQVAAA